jgi:GT2 family glycosyltransferase/protein-L-isoaspartate O-methyltransferase
MKFTGERVVPDKMKERYDIVQEHIVRYAFALPYVVRRNVLDLGCGTGYGTWLLTTSADKVTGVDHDEEAIHYAIKNFKTKWNNLSFSLVDVTRAIWREQFDVITCFEVIEHLDNFHAMLRKLPLDHRGKFIFSIPLQCKGDPYHKKDFEFVEVVELVDRYFSESEWFNQEGMIIQPGKLESEFCLVVAKGYKKRISVITLSWDGLDHTRKFVQSLRETEPEVELVIVDQGSKKPVRDFIKKNADKYHFNSDNVGFAVGMNQGMKLASNPVLIFVNNDVIFPENWISPLVESLYSNPQIGLVAPSVTNAGIPLTVRDKPGREVKCLSPFKKYPSGVCYVTSRKIMNRVGNWNEEYEIASGEDADLCFSIWEKGFHILYDQRVLLDHVGKGTAAVKLENWREVWDRNLQLFRKKWKHRLEPEGGGIS